ncbi:hypothetical protein MOX02_03380 [Methylobacterium oxalidis]|uniref:SapC family protein n=2 Tax=Methylobacterium oxalidis TaxID=944322 RepID=A0A512IX53_9HYPH|nr:hypothetical protein MOX02_03380 [Methylobacterium oxalidis]GJE31192.1 hypothetical protein LDDCCGHA_1368 [Methylobacterium oxalidis]GLS67679.1 hypothetical protein GCM10007888_60640 [Methylobacterium oxalidis]
MYRSLRALKQGSDEMIFDLRDYEGLEEILFSPTVAVEAKSLARHFPLVWRRIEDKFEFVALLSLSPLVVGANHLLAPGLTRPLLMEAYPFAISVAAGEDGQSAVLIEAAVPKQERQGTAVFESSGSFTGPAAHRMNALRVFASDRDRTAAYTQALAAEGLLEDWPLRLKIGEDGIEFGGLCVLARAPAQRERLAKIVTQHGFPFAELVTFHDLSLFNMQRLVDQHRAGRLAAQATAAQTASGESA